MSQAVAVAADDFSGVQTESERLSPYCILSNSLRRQGYGRVAEEDVQCPVSFHGTGLSRCLCRLGDRLRQPTSKFGFPAAG